MENRKGWERKGKKKMRTQTELKDYRDIPVFSIPPFNQRERGNASPMKDEYIYTIRDESAKKHEWRK